MRNTNTQPENAAQYALCAYLRGAVTHTDGFVVIDYAALCDVLNLGRQTTMRHIKRMCAIGLCERRTVLDEQRKLRTELRLRG